MTAFVVGITRPRPQADETADRLAARGYTPVVAPLMRLEPRALPGPDIVTRIGTIALTSRAAAMVLAPASHLHGVPVLTVGKATAEEARRAGFSNVRSSDGNVDDLVRHLADATPPVLHLAGEDHIGDLAERVDGATRRIIYAMAPVSDLPPVPALDVMLVYSPRSARLLASTTTPVWRDAPCIALSAAVAEPLGARVVGVALRPTEAALFDALDIWREKAGL